MGDEQEGLDLVGLCGMRVGGCDLLNFTDHSGTRVVGHDRLDLAGLHGAQGGGHDRHATRPPQPPRRVATLRDARGGVWVMTLVRPRRIPRRAGLKM